MTEIDWEDIADRAVPTTRSAFDSECNGCGGDIWTGDDIFLIDDEWVCEGCKDQA